MDGLYKIGAVSKITGINIPTLRAWENKFNIIEPVRINGTQRGYSKNDLDKLCLIKALVDLGDSISSISTLNINELEVRLEESSNKKNNFSSNESKESYSAVVIGTMVPNLDNPLQNLPRIKVVSKYELSDISEDDAIISDDADILIFEIPTLHIKTITWVKNIMRRSNIGNSIILYRFGSAEGIKSVNREKNINILRQPANSNDIQMLSAFTLIGKNEHRDTYVQRSKGKTKKEIIDPDQQPFSDKELWEISVMANPIHCECPKHLSSIITSLKGFEKYSADCEELGYEDKLLHQELEQHSIEARIIIEKALRKVIKENAINYSAANAS